MHTISDTETGLIFSPFLFPCKTAALRAYFWASFLLSLIGHTGNVSMNTRFAHDIYSSFSVSSFRLCGTRLYSILLANYSGGVIIL